MSDNNHISKNDFTLFQHNLMDQVEKERFLEHICSCDYCADEFATLMSDEIIPAPRDFKANLMKATKRPDIQLVTKARETSKKMQLFIYSLKVGTATVFALVLLLLTVNLTDRNEAFHYSQNNKISMPEDNQDNNKSLTTTIRESMDNISSTMLDFSNNIMNTEVTDYDQKEE